MMLLSKNGILFLLFALSFLTLGTAQGVVDLKNANYASSWTDIEVPGTGYNLKVLRTYNSRSLFNGVFGFGWCSDFETRIQVNPEGNLLLTECGAGLEILFASREVSKKDVEKTITQIINKMRAEKKVGQTEEQLRSFAVQMMENDDYRMDMARRFNVSVPVKEGTKFFANGREVENIVFAKGLYTRNLADGSSQRFSTDGLMTAMYDKNGNFLKLDYEKNLLVRVTDNNARSLMFRYHPNNKKIREIAGPFGLKAEYKFEGLDNLAAVTNQWKHSFTYKYDELHNLVRATYPDKTFIELKYDIKNDWVVGFTDRDKCVENYKYEFSEKNPKLNYWATLKKTCGKELVVDNRYEFWYGQRSDGSGFLKRVLTNESTDETDITYNDTGKPMVIRKNKDTMNFEYYNDGLIKTKFNNTMRMNFEHNNPSKKVSQVKTDYFNEKGKRTATRLTQFKYDNRGNLVFAQNSDGQTVTMTYDGKGRIATITDQAKKVVKIEYEERLGKPAVVTRPGLGTIRVTYKTNGDINKVDSKEGPTVAMQVASTFNNLLDIIAPATQELYVM